MKNNRIIRAYDSINPSAADKQRILDRVLQEVDPEEKPRKPGKARETVVYTAKPAKTSKRSIFGTFAACVAAVIIGGFVTAQMGAEPTQPVHIEPTAEAVHVTVNFSYSPVLEKYRTALREGWTKEQCGIEGISTRFYMPEPVDFTIGQRMLDINGDGRLELLIGHDINIWDLYTTLEDGTPIQLLSDEQDGWQYYLCENQMILAEYYSKEDCYIEYYRLDGHRLVMQEQLQYRDGQWMMETAEQEWRSISEREVQELTNSIKKLTPDWIPLRDYEKMYAEDLERYTPVLEKYRTALLENWDKDKCFENDISTIAAFGADTHTALGWCMKDIDDNGTQELIISYGRESGTFADLYCLQPDDVGSEEMVRSHSGMEYPLVVENGVCHLAKSEGRTQYTLCEDGTVICQIINEKGTSWCYYKVKPWGMELEGVLMYRSENEDAKAYSYGPHENDQTYISKEEAGRIIASHQSAVNLPVTPLVDWGDSEMVYYDSLIDIYRQAIREDWGPGICVENGISLMVGYYGEFVEELGYTTMDLDSNGIQELIITDGTNIYDLYTIIQDEETGPLRLVDAMERIEYFLTEDNMIYCSGSGGAGMHVYSLSSLEDDHLNMMTGFMYAPDTDPEDPWFWYDGENQGDPCGWDAQPIIDNWKIKNIPFTSFE